MRISDWSSDVCSSDLQGKTIAPVQEMCGKLKAALDARHSSDTLILARTDSLAVEGFDAAMDRAEAYLACGVDALFIEALRSKDELPEAAKRFGARIPLLAHMVEGGITPLHTVGDFDRKRTRLNSSH